LDNVNKKGEGTEEEEGEEKTVPGRRYQRGYWH
jgi:hypothetical protein